MLIILPSCGYINNDKEEKERIEWNRRARQIKRKDIIEKFIAKHNAIYFEDIDDEPIYSYFYQDKLKPGTNLLVDKYSIIDIGKVDNMANIDFEYGPLKIHGVMSSSIFSDFLICVKSDRKSNSGWPIINKYQDSTLLMVRFRNGFNSISPNYDDENNIEISDQDKFNNLGKNGYSIAEIIDVEPIQ